MSGRRTGPYELVDNHGQRRRRPVSSAGSFAGGPPYFEVQNAQESHTGASCRCIDIHLLAERLRLASRQGLPFGQSFMPIELKTSTWATLSPTRCAGPGASRGREMFYDNKPVDFAS